MIQINERHRLAGRDLNIIVETNRATLDTEGIAEESADDRWQISGYFGANIISAKNSLSKDMNIDDDCLAPLDDICNLVEKSIEDFKSIDIFIDEEISSKIVINKDWFISYKGQCYSPIKREVTQESKFTKEENVGKDKFVNCGFLPSLEYSLKSILNDIILDFLSSEKESTYGDLNKVISKFVTDSNSMIVEEGIREYISLDEENLDEDLV